MNARFGRGICALSCVVPLVMSLAVACKRQPEPEPTPGPIASAGEGQPASLPAPTPPQAALPAPAASQTPEQALSWKDPASFHRVEPKNPMRKASYEIPRAKGDSEDGELAVFYFGPGQGGGVDANVNRWIKQFGDVKPADVKRADRKANGLAEHTVEIVGGTFASGMPGGPSAAKSGYSLLGAIVETPSGPYFFKLTGPDKTVAEARKAFYGLLDSARVGS